MKDLPLVYKKVIVALCMVFWLVSCKEKTGPKELAQETIHQELWVDMTQNYLPKTAEWTNRVEVADINGDGLLDLLFANGGDYSEPGDPEFSRIFINKGPEAKFEEITDQLFKESKYISRVIKVRDINGDEIPDIILGTTYQNQTQLFLGLGEGKFKNVTDLQLPQLKASVGDLELGDVEGDGDLDIVLANWGGGSNMNNAGGRTILWLNDGKGYFKDVTTSQMPEMLVQFSWDLEFFDFDNDFDLDIAISCKRCASSRIFINDGKGFFEDKRLLPAYTNNYELEIMDVDGDGFLDLLTVNDGDIVDGDSSSRREHLFLNDEGKGFIDVTETYWPASENIGKDDNNIVFLDYDSDGDPDFLLSSLTGEDRLLVNDGTGRFKLLQPVLMGEPTPLTLSMVLGDINNDKKLDIVMGQGEGSEGIEERIFIGKDIMVDKAPPIISHYQLLEIAENETIIVRARIHDNKSPNMPQDWESVSLILGEDKLSIPMRWYGENLWFAAISSNQNRENMSICAVDHSGNKTCIPVK
ncbi:MAG: VCBS repeat-containing protein [Eudoraea sp.]